MANLPSRYPDVALHLTDRALTPLITSAREQQQLRFLSDLTHTALSAHESALRLGLGIPQRIIVEHDEGPVLLQTFLSPHATATTTTMTTAPLLAHNDDRLASTSPAAALPRVPSPLNGGSQDPHAPAQSPPQQQQQHQQHQGALATAAESRSAVPTPTTTTAYLRGGAATDDSQRGHGLFLGNGADSDDEHDDEGDEENPDTPAMLIGLVAVASSDDTLEARRAAARLERVGREIQERWSELQGQSG